MNRVVTAENPNSVAGWDARIKRSLDTIDTSGPVHHDVVMLRDRQVPELLTRDIYMHPPLESETAQAIREHTGALVIKRSVLLHGRKWTHLFVRDVLVQEGPKVLNGINDVLTKMGDSAGPIEGLALEPKPEEFRQRMQELNLAA